MKKLFYKISVLLSIFGFIFALASCGGNNSVEKTVSSAVLEDNKLVVIYTDGTKDEFDLKGTNGTNGINGTNGTNGINGKDGLTPHIGTNGNWWIGDVDTNISATGPKGDKGELGTDGEDGLTPFIGENGNWWIGEVDTNIKAQGPKGDKGDNGDDGLTPFIGENGNWWIGEVDTNIKAQGPKGDKGEDALTPFIGENGNWWIGEVDTNIKAQGPKGDKGEDALTPFIGENGNWWIGEVDTNIKAQGPKGDKGDDYVKATYTITLDYEDGTTIEVLEGQTVVLPKPVEENKKFIGWKTSEGTFVNDTTGIFSDLVLYPVFETECYISLNGSKVKCNIEDTLLDVIDSDLYIVVLDVAPGFIIDPRTQIKDLDLSFNYKVETAFIGPSLSPVVYADGIGSGSKGEFTKIPVGLGSTSTYAFQTIIQAIIEYYDLSEYDDVITRYVVAMSASQAIDTRTHVNSISMSLDMALSIDTDSVSLYEAIIRIANQELKYMKSEFEIFERTLKSEDYSNISSGSLYSMLDILYDFEVAQIFDDETTKLIEDVYSVNANSSVKELMIYRVFERYPELMFQFLNISDETRQKVLAIMSSPEEMLYRYQDVYQEDHAFKPQMFFYAVSLAYANTQKDFKTLMDVEKEMSSYVQKTLAYDLFISIQNFIQNDSIAALIRGFEVLNENNADGKIYVALCKTYMEMYEVLDYDFLEEVPKGTQDIFIDLFVDLFDEVIYSLSTIENSNLDLEEFVECYCDKLMLIADNMIDAFEKTVMDYPRVIKLESDYDSFVIYDSLLNCYIQYVKKSGDEYGYRGLLEDVISGLPVYEYDFASKTLKLIDFLLCQSYAYDDSENAPSSVTVTKYNINYSYKYNDGFYEYRGVVKSPYDYELILDNLEGKIKEIKCNVLTIEDENFKYLEGCGENCVFYIENGNGTVDLYIPYDYNQCLYASTMNALSFQMYQNIALCIQIAFVEGELVVVSYPAEAQFVIDMNEYFDEEFTADSKASRLVVYFEEYDLYVSFEAVDEGKYQYSHIVKSIYGETLATIDLETLKLTQVKTKNDLRSEKYNITLTGASECVYIAAKCEDNSCLYACYYLGTDGYEFANFSRTVDEECCLVEINFEDNTFNVLKHSVFEKIREMFSGVFEADEECEYICVTFDIEGIDGSVIFKKTNEGYVAVGDDPEVYCMALCDFENKKLSVYSHSIYETYAGVFDCDGDSEVIYVSIDEDYCVVFVKTLEGYVIDDEYHGDIDDDFTSGSIDLDNKTITITRLSFTEKYIRNFEADEECENIVVLISQDYTINEFALYKPYNGVYKFYGVIFEAYDMCEGEIIDGKLVTQQHINTCYYRHLEIPSEFTCERVYIYTDMDNYAQYLLETDGYVFNCYVGIANDDYCSYYMRDGEFVYLNKCIDCECNFSFEFEYIGDTLLWETGRDGSEYYAMYVYDDETSMYVFEMTVSKSYYDNRYHTLIDIETDEDIVINVLALSISEKYRGLTIQDGSITCRHSCYLQCYDEEYDCYVMLEESDDKFNFFGATSPTEMDYCFAEMVDYKKIAIIHSLDCKLRFEYECDCDCRYLACYIAEEGKYARFVINTNDLRIYYEYISNEELDQYCIGEIDYDNLTITNISHSANCILHDHGFSGEVVCNKVYTVNPFGEGYIEMGLSTSGLIAMNYQDKITEDLCYVELDLEKHEISSITHTHSCHLLHSSFSADGDCDSIIVPSEDNEDEYIYFKLEEDGYRMHSIVGPANVSGRCIGKIDYDKLEIVEIKHITSCLCKGTFTASSTESYILAVNPLDNNKFAIFRKNGDGNYTYFGTDYELVKGPFGIVDYENKTITIVANALTKEYANLQQNLPCDVVTIENTLYDGMGSNYKYIVIKNNGAIYFSAKIEGCLYTYDADSDTLTLESHSSDCTN